MWGCVERHASHKELIELLESSPASSGGCKTSSWRLASAKLAKFAVVHRPSTRGAPVHGASCRREPPVPFVTVRGKNTPFDVGDRVFLSGRWASSWHEL